MLRSLIKEIYEQILVEGRLEDAIKKYGSGSAKPYGWPALPDEVIGKLASEDPSGNLKYLMWMAGQVWKGRNRGYDIAGNDRRPQTIIKYVQAFHQQKNRLDKKDIYQYKEAEELRDALAKLPDSKRQQKKQAKSQGSEVVYESDNYLVLFMKSYEAVCHYGSETKWCITQDDETFLNYADRNTLFYFVIRKIDDNDQQEDHYRLNNAAFNKIAVEVKRDPGNFITDMKLWDAADHPWDKEKGSTIIDDEWPTIRKVISNDAVKRPKFQLPPEQRIQRAIDSYDYDDLIVKWEYDEKTNIVSWKWKINVVLVKNYAWEYKILSKNLIERNIQRVATVLHVGDVEVDIVSKHNNRMVHVEVRGERKAPVDYLMTWMQHLGKFSSYFHSYLNDDIWPED